MDIKCFIRVIIKNKKIEEYKYYYFYFKIKNDKLVFLFNPNQILKLIIGNRLYFDIENNGYYNAILNKTNYEIIKRYNKVIIEINVSDIINIIKDNKLYNNQYYNFYLVKKDKEINLFFINNNIVNAYKYINNEFILQKKFIYYREFLVDENDKLFCIYNYEILQIKQFKNYNYIVDLVKCKYNTTKTSSIYNNKNLFALYGKIYYRAYKDNNNEINLFLDGMFIGKNSISFKNNKIELSSCENVFLLII